MAATSRATTAPRWREQLRGKLATAEEAVSHIKSGDRVSISLAQATPFSLCGALAARLMELDGVVIHHPAALFNWDVPGIGKRFRLESFYLSPVGRELFPCGPGEFVPISSFRSDALPQGLDNFNVYLTTVSPPDDFGHVNFGDLHIMSKLLARKANLVIAEIDERSIRVGGDNSFHISEIDYFVERQFAMPDLELPRPSAEKERVTDTICAMVARELIPDQATIQVGVGSTSGMLMYHLKGHHELGVQTEIIPWGTAELVKAGVITGRHKKIFPGLVVGSGFAVATPRSELDFVDNNPAFQLYDFNFTDDIRLIGREDGIIAVNNALGADLTGQVNSESMGSHIYSGTGGQCAFAIASCLAGGKSIIVLPSTATHDGRRVSRIVPMLPMGSAVTVPRAFVQYIVTEHGIADLRGKSIRDRARELIAVAHPDFRGELTAEARRLWNL